MEVVEFPLEVEEFSNDLSRYVTFFRGKVFVLGEVTRKNSTFDTEELKEKYETMIHMPVNLMHTKEVVGCIRNADILIKEKKEEFWIWGVIWSFLFPEVGERIARELKKGEVSLSLEARPERVLCSSCKEEMDYDLWKAQGLVCGHNNHVIFKDFIFLGTALVFKPAIPAVRGAKAEALFDFSKISLDYLKSLSDKELIRLHEELHEDFRRKYQGHKVL